jgi:hypothetical protein
MEDSSSNQLPTKVPIFKSRFRALLVLGFVAWAIWMGLYIKQPSPRTAREQQATDDAYHQQQLVLQQLQAAQETRSVRTKALCHTASVCRRFTKVRQECAIAGDFNSCLRIKIGDKDIDTAMNCKNDGNLAFPPSDMPTRFECIPYDVEESL